MGKITIFGDDFETFDGFGVTDYVVQEDRPVLFDPGLEGLDGQAVRAKRGSMYHGSS